jgi:hypothetical protein
MFDGQKREEHSVFEPEPNNAIMEALRRVGWGLLVAPEGQREEDAVNLALALSISEEEQRLRTQATVARVSSALFCLSLCVFV